MATIDDLLCRLHEQAVGLALARHTDGELEVYLRGWAALAANATRILEALDSRPEDREIYVLLGQLTRGRATVTGVSEKAPGSLALTLGAIGDVLISSPAAVAQAGQAQRIRLSASIQAALYAAARTTCELAPPAYRDSRVDALRHIVQITELAALVPPGARASSLDRLTVSRLSPDTLDGAARLWLGEARAALGNHRLVTAVALMDTAATLALLCDTAGRTLREAARRQLVHPVEGRTAASLLASAAAAWRRAAAWPPNVQLGGRAHAYRLAMRDVRRALEPDQLGKLTLRQRVRTARAAMVSASAIGDLQAGAVAILANGLGLWIAHDRANLRPKGISPKVVLEWARMPADHPAGALLRKLSSTANQSLMAAADSLDQAVLPAPTGDGSLAVSLVDDRISVALWHTVEPHIATSQVKDRKAPPLAPRPDRRPVPRWLKTP